LIKKEGDWGKGELGWVGAGDEAGRARPGSRPTALPRPLRWGRALFIVVVQWVRGGMCES
jgi:hypothetical protein